MHNLLISVCDIVPEINDSPNPLFSGDELFYKLIENSREGITIVDKQLRILYRNDAAERISGWKSDSSGLKKIESLIHPADKEMIETLLKEVFSKPGMSKTATFRTKHFDGHFIWIDCTLSNFPDKTGFNNRCVFNFREVSIEKNYEKRIELNEKRFRALVENSTDGLVVFDKSRSAVYVSPAFGRILGYSEEEGYNLNGAEIIHPNDRQYTVAKLQEALNSPSIPIKNIIYRAKHKDGHYVVLNGTLTNLIDDPAIGGIVNNFRDITEKQKNEADLIASENKYKSLFANNPVPLLLWKSETSKIKDCNEAAIAKYGYTREEFLALTIEDLWPPNDQIVLVSDIMKSIRLNSIFNIVRKHKKKNGEIIDVDISGQLINYNGEEMILAMCNDVTDQKRSEKLLKELNLSLQKQAKELAVSNDELEQFAFIASHDLQEPLRMVTAFVTQLERKYGDIIDDKGKQYIHFAVDGAKRMRQIILDLLEYSRTGRTQASLEFVNFNNLINEILVLFKKQMKESGARITFENLPVFLTYQTPVRAVFQNLIGNSLKYRKEGEPPLIKIACTETPTHYQFFVKDNGIGIAPVYFDKIFVIFQRLHNKDHYSGTGVGLAITKKIVENMGGSIWLESEEGAGTTFYFTVLKNK